uniref:Uncharacterized protein n=1 Tax=Anguilla anguilla TaxID=7936 RepID=A0A0E9XRC9_ANGAN
MSALHPAIGCEDISLPTFLLVDHKMLPLNQLVDMKTSSNEKADHVQPLTKIIAKTSEKKQGNHTKQITLTFLKLTSNNFCNIFMPITP